MIQVKAVKGNRRHTSDMVGRVIILLLALCIAGCAKASAPVAVPVEGAGHSVLVMNATPEQVEAGARIVQLQCVSCHAVRSEDRSRNPDAPALRTLAERYPVAGLAEAFALGIMTGHPNMPDFRFSSAQINDILAYLESIQTRQAAELDRRRSDHPSLG
ncbi:MAG: cytochrome c [Hyphomonadaceae bacterium]